MLQVNADLLNMMLLLFIIVVLEIVCHTYMHFACKY